MKDTIKIINERMEELKNQFELLKKQVADSKTFIMKCEQAMGISSAAYNELENIKILLEPKEEEAEETNDEKSDNESKD